MPAVTNDLFKVILTGAYFSQSWSAVFWYYNTSGVGNLNLLDVANDFDANVMAAFAAVCNLSVTFTNIRVVHVNGTLADVNITPTSVAGIAAGTELPPFIASSIRLNRTTKDTRNGWKRIIGGVEEEMGALTWSGAFQINLAALGATFLIQLDMGGALSNLDPVIIKALTPTTWVYNLIAGYQVRGAPTTQNSRKVGVGV